MTTTKIIAVIEKNKISFDGLEEFAAPLLYEEHTDETRAALKKNLNDYIWSKIEPYVRFITVDENDEFIGVVCRELTNCFPERKPDDFFYHTEGSYSFPKKYIELVHCQPVWNGYKDAQPENMNTVGCLFSLKHTVIENTCIVIANRYDLTAPRFTAIDSVTKEDIIRIVRRRYFFSAVMIKDDSMVKYYYQDPRYLITKIYGLDSKDNIQKLSFSHLKYNLIFYFQQDKTKYLNTIATRINGLYRVYGDILVLHEMEENIFANISIHEMKRINVLSYGRLYDRQLKDHELHTMPTVEIDKDGKENEKKITPMWSRYVVIENRMKQWQQNKNNCINCNKTIVNLRTCQRCHRTKYCSEECEKEFGWYHNDDCINSAA